MPNVVTIFDVAKYRLGSLEGGSRLPPGGMRPLTGQDFEDVGLPMLGGCQRCGASVSAGNAAPSRTGYLMCARDCIGGDGFETVEEANRFMFPDEYTWAGVRA